MAAGTKSIIFQFLNILDITNDSEKNGAMMKSDVQKLQNELVFAFLEHFTASLVLKVVGIG